MTMAIPFNEWLTIDTYRDFYDVPRLILAVEKTDKFWIFDSKFDHDIDDYSSEYIIYYAGQKIEEARLTFMRYADAVSPAAAAAAADAVSISVRLVEFDQTRRHQLLLRKNK